MISEIGTTRQRMPFWDGGPIRPNRPYNVSLAVRAPGTPGVRLDDKSLAFIIPIGLLTLFMIGVVISPL